MKVESRTVVEVLFVLREDQARWLMAYLQNPPCDPSEEDGYNATNRSNLFHAIKKALPNQ